VVVLAVLVMLEVVTVSAAVISAVPEVSAELAGALVALTVAAATAGWAEARAGNPESIALEVEPVAYRLALSGKARPLVLQLSMRHQPKWMPS
jgi:hypothetical protein